MAQQMCLLDFCQNILEYCIVLLYTVIQVDFNHLVSEVVDFLFIHPDLLRLCLERGKAFVQFHPLGGRRTVDALLQIGDRCTVAGLLLVNIVGADASG